MSDRKGPNLNGRWKSVVEWGMDTTLETLLAQEADLQFSRFDSDTAWRLGSWLVAKAKKDGLVIAIGITRGTQRLFHWAAEGTSPDNDTWIDRKTRTVYRFRHSSYYMGRKCAKEEVVPAKKYFLDEHEYSFNGGCFPILVKGAGMVGTVTVSGLKDHIDHAVVVEALRAILRK